MTLTRTQSLIALSVLTIAALVLVAVQPRGTEAQGTFTLRINKVCAPADDPMVYEDFRLTMSDGEDEETLDVSCPEGGTYEFTSNFSVEETWTLAETVPGFISPLGQYEVAYFCGNEDDNSLYGSKFTDDAGNSIQLSDIPAGEEVICAVINRIQAGHFVATKICDPATEALTEFIDASFEIEIDGPGANDLSFGARCGRQRLLPAGTSDLPGLGHLGPGEYTLTEAGTLPDVLDISLFNVSIVCRGQQPVSGTSASFEIPDIEKPLVVCEVTNSLPDNTIAVVKECNPSDIEETFTLQLILGTGGDPQVFDDVSCGDVVLFEDVPAGQHTLMEELGDPSPLVTIECSDGDGLVVGNFRTVTMGEDGAAVACTVSNTQMTPGDVVIVKQCEPADIDDEFAFELDDGTSDPRVIVDVECGDTVSFQEVLQGGYTLTELVNAEQPDTPVTDYEVSMQCGDELDPTEGASRSLNKEADEDTIICIVRNVAPPGSITITKQCEPADIDDRFAFVLEGASLQIIFDVGCGDEVSFLDVPAGTYRLTEQMDDGGPSGPVTDYRVTIECTGDSEPTEGPIREALVKATDAETIECTVTNTAVPGHAIVVTKTCAEPPPAGEAYEVTLTPPSGDPVPMQFESCSGVRIFAGMPSGTYTLEETNPLGATNVLITCLDLATEDLIAGVTGTSVTLEVDSDVLCAVFNDVGSFVPLQVRKECAGDLSGPFRFSIRSLGIVTRAFELDCEESIVIPSILSDTVTLSETGAGNTISTTIDCGSGETEGTTVTLEVTGPTLCTFTNVGEELPPGGETADVGVTADCTPEEVAPGDDVTCTLVVTNHGPQTAQNVSLTTFTPANTTLVSFTGPGEPWECEAPAPGGTGAIFCDPDMAPGASASFTLVLNVDDGAPLGAQLSLNVAVDTDTEDPNPDNDTAVALVIVAADGGPAAQPTPIVITIDNDNTNVIGIDNANENANLNSNANENENENANRNQNDNANTNTQDQGNGQDQDNSNEQTNNIEASPEVNIGR